MFNKISTHTYLPTLFTYPAPKESGILKKKQKKETLKCETLKCFFRPTITCTWSSGPIYTVSSR
jgi:hypothetical protein